MLLLMALRLGRRYYSSPQWCYLHRHRTIPERLDQLNKVTLAAAAAEVNYGQH